MQQLQTQSSQTNPNNTPQNSNQGSVQGIQPMFCQKENCEKGPITKVCLSSTCGGFRLLCESEACWRDHKDHFNKVVVIQEAVNKREQISDALKRVRQDYNVEIEKKKKELVVALEKEIKMTETPIFKALESKPLELSWWTSSDLNSYAANLAQIDTSTAEAKDPEANTKIDKLKNTNIAEGVQRMFNPQSNLTFASPPPNQPKFQPQKLQNTGIQLPQFTPLKTSTQQLQNIQVLQSQTQPLIQSNLIQQTINIESSQMSQSIGQTNFSNGDDLIITPIVLDVQAASHGALLFDKKSAYSAIKVSNGKTIQLQMGMDKIAVLPQNLLSMPDPKIELVIEYEGGTFLGDGKNKFGLFFGSFQRCSFEEKSNKNNLLVFGDDGILWVFGAKSEIDDFKIEEEKSLISMSLDKTTNQFTITNLSTNVPVTIPCNNNSSEVYFCIVLSAGGAKVSIK